MRINSSLRIFQILFALLKNISVELTFFHAIEKPVITQQSFEGSFAYDGRLRRNLIFLCTPNIRKDRGHKKQLSPLISH